MIIILILTILVRISEYYRYFYGRCKTLMSVKCRAMHAQPTDEHWWQNRNIRDKAILLHLQPTKSRNKCTAAFRSKMHSLIRLYGHNRATFLARIAAELSVYMFVTNE